MKNNQLEKLSDYADYSKAKISIAEIDTKCYFSTENMLPNKGGVTEAAGLPTQDNVTKVLPENVLVSNIRPYFKKIYFANELAGASNDVLCFVAKNGCLPRYLYYLLSSDSFFDYMMAGAKGTKMPRGDKGQIMNFPVWVPAQNEQSRIVSVLSALDEKIENISKINHNLEEQAKAIFKSWFVDFEPFNGKMPKSWLAKTLADVSKIGAGGDKPHCVSEIQTPEFQYPIYSNGLANDGLYGYASSAKIYEESITVSARGTIGFVCLRQEPYVPIVRLITLIPNTCFVSAKYLYLYLKGINISGTGTTQQQLTVPDFQKTSIMVPDNDTMKRFTICADSIFEQIKHNAKEMRTLAQLRDTLLPKLMSGEIDVSEVEV